ncbi:unnamed protein product, partial [Ectocarpus sp. 8 AP-2014]
RQHPLVYLAALDDPSPAAGTISDINFQAYAGFDMTGYLEWGVDGVCDSWDETTYTGEPFEPRCRLWYQDAIEIGNTGVIFTNPYVDADSEKLTMSAAAPVFNSAGTVAAVVGLDVDAGDIESSIKDLTVIDDDGYAYLLAPGGDGQVAVHRDLLNYGGVNYILDLEFGDDADENGEEESQFLDSVTEISAVCSGSAEYPKDGSTWILAWKHETVSGAGASTASDNCGDGGFIAVVTVSESVLLEAFSETKSQISRVVLFASLIMALVLVVIAFTMGVTARFVACGIVNPINQLIDVVHSLNRMDFSRQAPGTWMVNDISSPEVEELMDAFEQMSTIVKFANTTLATGNTAEARRIYVGALALFTKLGNDRGVSIVNNNLGNVYALQAGQFVAKARDAENPDQAKALMEAAQGSFADAITNYELAINDAEILCAATNQQPNDASPLHRSAHHGGLEGVDEAKCEEGVKTEGAALADVDANYDDDDDDDENKSHAALCRQLANRKYNLALCLAAKGKSAVAAGGQTDLKTIDEARNLLQQCIQLAPAGQHNGGHPNNGDTKTDLRRFGYLLQVSALEREQTGRSREAGEALDAAELVIVPYERHYPDGGAGAAMATPLETPVQILRQRLLEARAAQCVASGYHEAAIDHYTQALIGTGDLIDPSVAWASLLGLRGLASDGSYGRLFSPDLLVALGVHPDAGADPEGLTSAIDHGLDRVKRIEPSMAAAQHDPREAKVDLCFVMDCTGSMQRWIDQAKTKLLDIIDQAKKDVKNISLRVAFVGYRDFGDKVQYESFDFHEEKNLPKLLAALNKIKAYGGKDFPEDLAGGLKLATELDWRGNI